jgi:hypothetical protein
MSAAQHQLFMIYQKFLSIVHQSCKLLQRSHQPVGQFLATGSLIILIRTGHKPVAFVFAFRDCRNLHPPALLTEANACTNFNQSNKNRGCSRGAARRVWYFSGERK